MVQDQWRTGMGGAYALDIPAVITVMDLKRTLEKERTLDKILDIAAIQLNYWAKEKDGDGTKD